MWRILVVWIAAVSLLAPDPSGGGTTAPELAFARGGNVWTIGARRQARAAPPAQRVLAGLVARRLEAGFRLEPLG